MKSEDLKNIYTQIVLDSDLENSKVMKLMSFIDEADNSQIMSLMMYGSCPKTINESFKKRITNEFDKKNMKNKIISLYEYDDDDKTPGLSLFQITSAITTLGYTIRQLLKSCEERCGKPGLFQKASQVENCKLTCRIKAENKRFDQIQKQMNKCSSASNPEKCQKLLRVEASKIQKRIKELESKQSKLLKSM